MSDDRTQVLRRIGRNIRSARTERDIAQEALAERAGVHRTHLTKIEAGAANASAFTLWRIARGLGVPLGELVAEL
jgi:transcriptional regulator with XRE-family HTH domain